MNTNGSPSVGPKSHAYSIPGRTLFRLATGAVRMIGCSLEEAKQRVLLRMAASHRVGPSLEDALNTGFRLAHYGWRSTIAYWKNPQDDAESVAANYLHLLERMGLEGSDWHVSLKIPDLDYRFDLLSNVLECAAAKHIFVQCDTREPETAPHSFTVLLKARRTFRNIGCTLPARWRRSLVDAEYAIDSKIPVRVVKGQWRDSDEPNLGTRVSFLRLIDILAGRACRVSVATHDASLVREALDRLRSSGTPCELELLCTLPLGPIEIAESVSVPVRLYIPYGFPYLPYRIKDFPNRAAIAAWVVRDLVCGKHRGLP